MRLYRSLIAASLFAGAIPNAAWAVSFGGTATNINSAPAPDAGCAPLPLRVTFGPASTVGTSNFGAFTYQQTHCTTGGPGPYSGGIFGYFFAAGDSFTGTYSGLASASGTMGLLNNVVNYVVTSGTGRFAAGTGTITGTGTVDFRNGPPVQTLALAGDVAAVPEASTWALMLIGFGAVGCMARSRRPRGACDQARSSDLIRRGDRPQLQPKWRKVSVLPLHRGGMCGTTRS